MTEFNVSPSDREWMDYVEERVRAAMQPQRNVAAGKPLHQDRHWPDAPASCTEDEAEEFFRAAAQRIQVRRLERAGAPDHLVAQMNDQWRAAHDARWVDILDRSGERVDGVVTILEDVPARPVEKKKKKVGSGKARPRKTSSRK